MMLIVLSPEPHSEDKTLTPVLGQYIWGWPPDRLMGLTPGGLALIMGSLIGLGAYGQAQQDRAGTQELQKCRDSMDA